MEARHFHRLFPVTNNVVMRPYPNRVPRLVSGDKIVEVVVMHLDRHNLFGPGLLEHARAELLDELSVNQRRNPLAALPGVDSDDRLRNGRGH